MPKKVGHGSNQMRSMKISIYWEHLLLGLVSFLIACYKNNIRIISFLGIDKKTRIRPLISRVLVKVAQKENAKVGF